MTSRAAFPYTSPAQKVEFEALDAQGERMIVRGYAKLDSIETDYNGDMSMTLTMVPGYLPGGSLLTCEYPDKKKAAVGSKHFPQSACDAPDGLIKR